jgi:outer membrane lipoprotein-sorting protein
MWIIEESHRGGPVRMYCIFFLILSIIVLFVGTQYTTELILNNIQRNDNRFQTIICSMVDEHEKREYIIDVLCI